MGQAQVFLNLTDGTGNMVWQVSMGVNSRKCRLVCHAELNPKRGAHKTLIFSGADATEAR